MLRRDAVPSPGIIQCFSPLATRLLHVKEPECPISSTDEPKVFNQFASPSSATLTSQHFLIKEKKHTQTVVNRGSFTLTVPIDNLKQQQKKQLHYCHRCHDFTHKMKCLGARTHTNVYASLSQPIHSVVPVVEWKWCRKSKG